MLSESTCIYDKLVLRKVEKVNTSHSQDIGYQIQQISHTVKQLQNEWLLKENLSVSHLNVMLVLYEEDGVPQTHIQTKLGVRASSLSKLIDILIRKGLVTREAKETDARTKIISLTALGKEKETHLQKVRGELESQVTKNLDADEVKQLADLLARVKQNVNHEGK